MEKIREKLIEIAEYQLKECQKNKTIPSKEVLDIVKIIMSCQIAM